jgi:DNA-binding MarR family transcriptional regulator
MGGKLLKEIHKSRPFESLQQEVFLNVVRTADHLMRGFEDLLKPFTLSATQYNVLRILRGHLVAAQAASGSDAGAGDQPGVPCKVIGEQMITRDPDITRLLDRLEGRGLITRQRDTRDRRIVSTRITQTGLDILGELDGPVADFHRRQLAHVDDARLAQLIDLLEQARGAG